MNYYLITGTSRGLGEALARNLLEPGNTLFCFSRHPNPGLERSAGERGISLHYHTADLSDLREIDSLLVECFKHIGPADSITLINNAGVLDPMGPIDTVSTAEIANNIRINLTVLMVLSSVFIRLAEGYECSKTIVNISSGAGKHPYDGWGPYCAAKAGVDMFTRCLAEEQQGRSRPVKVLSIAPGVVDTDLQRRVRAIDESLFRQKEKFLRLKREGRIHSPDQAARNLLRALRERELTSGSVVDLWKAD